MSDATKEAVSMALDLVGRYEQLDDLGKTLIRKVLEGGIGRAPGRGDLEEAVLELLEAEVNPLTRRRIALVLDRPVTSISGVLNRLRKRGRVTRSEDGWSIKNATSPAGKGKR